jgi:SAM-dependent methyltransferase
MKPLAKIDLDNVLSGGKPVILDIGCGNNKRPGAIGIDKVDLPSVDIIADVEQGLGFFPDGSADQIYSFHFLEHINNLEDLMAEMIRVLKKNGRAIIEVPHFSNPYYYSDPTHKRFFGLYTFYYFVEPKYQLRRKVPTHYSPFRIRVISQKIIFDSPFFAIKLFKKFLQLVVNSSSLIQELYEEHLCYLIPCSAVKTIFTKDTD